MTFAIRTLVNAVALWLAAAIVQGIHLGEGGDTSSNLWTVLLVALIFGVVNAIVKPLAIFFSIPFLLVTLGLFMFVVNALMLQLTSWLSDKLGIAFHVDDVFWSGIWGALVVTIVASVLNSVLPDRVDDLPRPR